MNRQPGPRTVLVLGGSVAGLLAAAACSPHSDRVLVVERDLLTGPSGLPLPLGPRRGTPQAVHTHALLASGREAIERLLPGTTEQLVARGAASGDIGWSTWHIGGVRVRPVQVGANGLVVSRLALEAHLRARVRALPNVTLLDRTEVRGLLAGADGAVTGARLLDLSDPAAGAEPLTADLVVDATGRPGRASRWFEEHAWPVPAEDRVVVGVRYATTHVRFRPDDVALGGAVVSAATPATPRAAAAMYQEDGTWILTLIGFTEEAPPLDPEGFLRFARTVVAPEVAQLLAGREQLHEPVPYRFPHSVRRRIEGVRLPRGYAVIGDAICSFDPVFGQGMSVAALQAEALGDRLRQAPGDLQRALGRYHQDAVERADRAWRIVVGADLLLEGVQGPVPSGHAALTAYLGAVRRVSGHDAAVARALLRVVNLLDPPQALMRPAVLVRVVRSMVGAAGARPRGQSPDAQSDRLVVKSQ